MTDRRNRTWTAEELAILEDEWGEKTPDAIARILGRTTKAVRTMAKVRKLGSYLESSEYFTPNQCTKMLGYTSKVLQRTWIPHGLKTHKRRTAGGQRNTVILHSELMEFLRKNQDLWDSRKCEPYALGTEPAWLQEKRRRDALLPKPIGTKYTAAEDRIICAMLRNDATQKEIAKRLGRSKSSVNARIGRLDVWGTGGLKPKGARGSGNMKY